MVVTWAPASVSAMLPQTMTDISLPISTPASSKARTAPTPVAPASKGAAKAEQPAAAVSSMAAPAVKQKKLSFKEQRELDELPKLIAALEDEQTALALQLSDPDFYKKNAAEAKRIHARVEQIEAELLAALERWEALGKPA